MRAGSEKPVCSKTSIMNVIFITCHDTFLFVTYKMVLRNRRRFATVHDFRRSSDYNNVGRYHDFTDVRRYTDSREADMRRFASVSDFMDKHQVSLNEIKDKESGKCFDEWRNRWSCCGRHHSQGEFCEGDNM